MQYSCHCLNSCLHVASVNPPITFHGSVLYIGSTKNTTRPSLVVGGVWAQDGQPCVYLWNVCGWEGVCCLMPGGSG